MADVPDKEAIMELRRFTYWQTDLLHSDWPEMAKWVEANDTVNRYLAYLDHLSHPVNVLADPTSAFKAGDIVEWFDVEPRDGTTSDDSSDDFGPPRWSRTIIDRVMYVIEDNRMLVSEADLRWPMTKKP